jgi:glycerol-3-phosphate O-acyltransferase
MTRAVELPLWLFLLIIAFALTAFFSHFLFPSVRWFFRRRMQKVVTRLNQRLDRPIQPFKLMARQDMIVRLVHDPRVMEAVVADAEATGEPESVVFERARAYAREIVPSFSATFYFGFAIRAARWLAQLIYRVRISYRDPAAIRAIDKDATVVFVMNHRSNMDYVLVTHLAARRSALSYAVGEWARIWPLSVLIRAMGAYFIRRRSNSPLYRRVLARYVQMAVEEGVTQAIFPEGGLSLDGRVGAPRLGLLGYIVAAWQPGRRDVVFIPVALAYDRVLEDRVLIAAAGAGERRFRASVLRIAGFFLRHLYRRIRGRFHLFGTAGVSFGRPLSLAEFMQGTPGATTEVLAEALMARVARNVPVLPVPLTATVLADAPGIAYGDAVLRAEALGATLAARGAQLTLPSGSVRAALDQGLASLTLRGIVEQREGQLLVTPGNEGIISFYAAGIRQILDAPAA